MKIAIAADLYWPTINGVSVAVRTLAQGLAERGHEVLVMAPSQSTKPETEMDGKVKIVRMRSVSFSFYQNFKISLAPVLEVKKVLDDFAPDIIHVEMLLLISQSAMRYGQKYNIPLVATNHAMPENLMDNLRLLSHVSRPINYVVRSSAARFYEKADVITMPTQSAIDGFAEASRVKKPLLAISNGINLGRFKPGRASDVIYDKYNIPKDKPVVGHLGRLDGEKHLSVLIEAFSMIASENKDAILVIVGDGTDAAHLKEYVHAYNISDRVIFTGRVDEEDKAYLHQVFDLYAITSPVELQSIATLESMASGNPVVAVDAMALGELCQNGRNGFLVEQDNPEQMADAIKKILDDDDLREGFSKESLKIANEHALDTTLDKYEQIYSDLIELR